ncbi:phosphatidylinositol 4-phosphate 5-kinase 9 isoform X2 [Gossypium hirsutum]|uniref:Phosphatidylinositol 4-phosphate 5-kinase n=1 Tax=Gossypium hirsutum TaxID=3635 RepID=A0ABM2ZWU8_GOSHI|nr:phosphatidylinositol 4-phosphate 5-kinase 9-like isoform X2 [Gossypium hirsutum]
MSGPVVTLDNVEGARSCAERTRSLDAITDKDNGSILTNGEAVHSSETAAFRVGELLLPNGDLYSGSLQGNVPEGRGKYVWKVGCVYEGEWRRGMRQGTGKIQWPSGTFYDGEFSGGYMHGTGTYIDSNKLTYKGRWKLNLKHGLGYQVYPNGDVFEGAWIQGTPEGPGKYTWVNGNVYLGNMKGGKMSGKGTLTWTNGDSFEGSWLNGMMHGLGVYNWRDGGCYVGTWTRGLKDGKGSFYPKGSRLPALQEVYLNALRKRGLLPDLRKQNHSHIHHASSVDMGSVKVGGTRVSHRNSGEGNLLNLEQSRNRNVSLERRWSLEVSIEKVIGYDSSLELTESFIEGEEKGSETNAPVLEREYMQGVLISEFVLNNSFSASSRRAKRRQKMFVKEVKRPGEIIIKGHRSYDLMLSLQLGIRYTVGKITPVQRREVRASDFGRRASFWMNFPKEGSQLTPPHQSEDFKWKDYCPMVFRNLREMFKIDAADYMISICGNDVLRELSSPGKSGSIFFLSQDDRFMIKTLRKSEVKNQTIKWSKGNEHSRVLSYARPQSVHFLKFRFVVMGNMFCTELRIHRRFDLKGSSLGRSADNIEIDENTTLKDLDLNYCFYLEPSWREALLRQIETDSKFLESQHIMDYSLLLGVHYRAPQHLRSHMSYNRVDGLGSVAEEEEDGISNYPQGLVLVPRGTDDSVVVGPHIRGRRLRASSAGDEEVDLLLPGTARLQIQLGVNMPARAELIPGKEENMFHEAYDVVLYLGMIDILQEYNMSKKIEHAYKSLQFDSVSISAVDPTFYSQRFLEFIQKVFPQNSIKG